MKKLYYALAVASLGFSMSCGNSTSLDPKLDENLEWYGTNRQSLQDFIDNSPGKGQVAVFDWDNTVFYRDIGDATMYYFIANNLILQPANKDWKNTSPLMTDEANAALKAACDGQAEAGQPIVSDQSSEASKKCADQIVTIYNTGYVDGAEIAAFDEAKFDGDLMEPVYAWTVQLEAGYSPDQVREFARKAFDFNASNPHGTKQKIGNTEQAADARVYAQMADLIEALQAKGFDVWVSSASSQYIVDAVAENVGIKADHVIGVRPVVVNGKITPSFEGCGTEADGNVSIINYRFGKRCWLNKELFGVADGEAQLTTPGKQAFAAGDSNTDIPFTKDATGLRLAINRNKGELMCNAYANLDGKWLINPRFINPLPKYPKNDGFYSCGDYDLPNQEDTVFAQ